MHWGNIGSFLGGLATLLVAAAALIRGPAALRDWRERQREQAAAAREEAETIRLDRQRGLLGWSSHGIKTYDVTLITEEEEFDRARDELVSGLPTAYVVLRVSMGSEAVAANRAQSLRQLAETEGQIARVPTAGEREALEAGLAIMGNPELTVIPPREGPRPGWLERVYRSWLPRRSRPPRRS